MSGPRPGYARNPKCRCNRIGLPATPDCRAGAARAFPMSGNAPDARAGAVVTRSLVSHMIRSSSMVTCIPLLSGRWPGGHAPRPSERSRVARTAAEPDHIHRTGRRSCPWRKTGTPHARSAPVSRMLGVSSSMACPCSRSRPYQGVYGPGWIWSRISGLSLTGALRSRDGARARSWQ